MSEKRSEYVKVIKRIVARKIRYRKVGYMRKKIVIK